MQRIEKSLLKNDAIQFIEDFTDLLYDSFGYLRKFFCEDQIKYMGIHSIISLGGIGIVIPFIIKAYKKSIEKREIEELCLSFESLLIRHRLVRTRARIATRLTKVYTDFPDNNSGIQPILGRIKELKRASSGSWDGYWSNEELEKAIQLQISHPIARFILWKYENYLALDGPSGYEQIRFSNIAQPELEHIAPQTENPGSGYDDYDEEFKTKYLHCFGNYLLVSGSHNKSMQNKAFDEKRKSYGNLNQHQEIRKMTEGGGTWSKCHIKKRHEKITNYIMENL